MSVTSIPEMNIKFNTGNTDLDKQLYQNFAVLRELLSSGYLVSGNFTTVDGKTVTVINGIVTGIV